MSASSQFSNEPLTIVFVSYSWADITVDTLEDYIGISEIQSYSFFRRQSLVRQASIQHTNMPHPLVRQMSVHDAEDEQSHLAPKVEGRIFLLDDKVILEHFHLFRGSDIL